MPSDEWDAKAREDRWKQAMKEPFRELPDDLRVPLHSLQADLDNLIGRIANGCCVDEHKMIVGAMRNYLSQVETAAYRLNAALHEADTAAERRGIERAAGWHIARAVKREASAKMYRSERNHDKGRELDRLAEDDRVDANHIRALATPMADAGPTEPAGASDREG